MDLQLARLVTSKATKKYMKPISILEYICFLYFTGYFGVVDVGWGCRSAALFLNVSTKIRLQNWFGVGNSDQQLPLENPGYWTCLCLLCDFISKITCCKISFSFFF